MTPQRRAIIETTTGSLSHLSAEEIHQIVSKRMPDISLATVYNTLRELVAIGAAREMNLSNDARRYEFSREMHSHFVCLTCGKIQDVQTDHNKLASLFKLNNGNYAIRYEATVYGYCANCAPTGIEK
jgi:Fur family ferric uptake transcriptional regulator